MKMITQCILLMVLAWVMVQSAFASNFAGGTGEPNDPYQIASADQLCSISDDPDLLDKCFVLISDIDLSGYVYVQAVIGEFSGSFDGDGYLIKNLHLEGPSDLGLFGCLTETASVRHLGVIDANILAVADGNKGFDLFGGNEGFGLLAGRNQGTIHSCYSAGIMVGNDKVGGLVGENTGCLINSYSTGTVSGHWNIGGLAGMNLKQGYIYTCYSSASVSGNRNVGGLVGGNFGSGCIDQNYSSGAVQGNEYDIGGLVGDNTGRITQCCSLGDVSGRKNVGGLVGANRGCLEQSYGKGSVVADSDVAGLVGFNTGSGYIRQSYCTGAVSGSERVGGLTGRNDGFVEHCLWDIEATGQVQSTGGIGLTSEEMMQANSYALNSWANDSAWLMYDGVETPHLRWKHFSGQPMGDAIIPFIGQGTQEDPYRLETDLDLVLLGKASLLWDKHVILAADIDLTGHTFQNSVILEWNGVFDGNQHQIQHLDLRGLDDIGLFGSIASGAVVKKLGITDANAVSTGYGLGLIAGTNRGDLFACYSSGALIGAGYVGGLVGWNIGSVAQCYSICSVNGNYGVGGLVGYHYGDMRQCYGSGSVLGQSTVGGLIGRNGGTVFQTYTQASVRGNSSVGGLIGDNQSIIVHSYSASSVDGDRGVGGLVGGNQGAITQSYSFGAVSGNRNVGGLVGSAYSGGGCVQCLWDTVTSGLSVSAAGEGLTTSEMVKRETYVSRAWDFIDESENGLHETWQMPINGGYPVLSVFTDNQPAALSGSGTVESPYLISTASEFGAIIYYDAFAHYALTKDIDMSGISWSVAPISSFQGCFDGQGHVISGLKIEGERQGYVGLFDVLSSSARIQALGIVDAMIWGFGGYTGGLAGYNAGRIDQCFSSGYIYGKSVAGGLVGGNSGSIFDSYSMGEVRGNSYVGGLAGSSSEGAILNCYSAAAVTGPSSGIQAIGGLMGTLEGGCERNSFWDIQVSGQETSPGGQGVTTATLQDSETFQCWDDGIWTLLAGQDYPRLAWEAKPGDPVVGRRPYFGSGSATDPYLIWTAEDLCSICRYPSDWDKTFHLMTDIDMTGIDPNAWQTIGTPEVPFVGRFYGNGFSICHFKATLPEDDFTGLFGSLGHMEMGERIEDGLVQDLTLIDAEVSGKDVTGILVGMNEGTIRNCHVTGLVRGRYGVGGLVGWNLGEVQSVSAEVYIEGTNQVYSVVGHIGPDFPGEPHG